MRSSFSLEAHEGAVRKFVGSKRNVARIRTHLQQILRSEEFRGRHRSSQFLSYIVDKAIEENFDLLKERLIGVELFGRSPSYDTGEDAIVRVTASDVRRRLLQYYGMCGADTELRIGLRPGSYIPEFAYVPAESTHSVVEPPETALLLPEDAVNQPPDVSNKDRVFARLSDYRWKLLSLLLASLCAALGGVVLTWLISSHMTATSTLPWPTFFHSARAIQLVTSDPNIAEIQELTDRTITIVDYANHRYIPEPNKLTPDEERLCRIILRGDKSASVDTPIAVSIAELAQQNSRMVVVHSARAIQTSDLKTDDNYVLLGSPRSNPWSSIFSDHLDFQFAIDNQSHAEFIRNVHPRPNERASYVPTAQGWQTGDSYAIIAMVRNPDQNGLVLLIAGASGEGTQAAGKLVTDLPSFSSALQSCGIPRPGPFPQFEMLLHLSTMAGSSKDIRVIACHTLPGPTVP